MRPRDRAPTLQARVEVLSAMLPPNDTQPCGRPCAPSAWPARSAALGPASAGSGCDRALAATSSARRRRLAELLLQRPVASAERLALQPGIIVVVPSYANPARERTLPVLLQSLADQRCRLPTRVALADNGITPTQRQRYTEAARALGLPLDIIDARPRCASERSPEHARNRALAELTRRAAEQPGYRHDSYLLLDDDCALLPGALDALDQARRAHPDACAVVGASVPVRQLDQAYARAAREGAPERPGAAQRLPVLFDGASVDLAALVAFSGDVAAKTNCLLLDAATVHRVAGAGGELFVGGPHGTGEDMMASLALGRHGYIYRCGGARVLDQEPDPSRGVVRQRAAFGRDHVHLQLALAELGLAPEGVVILEPRAGGGWLEWRVPGRGSSGLVVAPAELEAARGVLLASLEDPAFVAALGDPFLPLRLAPALRALDQLLAEIAARRGAIPTRPRSDLPSLAPLPTGTLRWSPMGRVAQLAGNLLGLLDLEPRPGARTPPAFVFGLRQPVSWEP